MTRRRSKAEVEMENLLGTLDPSSERFRVLAAARDFKASWVILGEILTTVRDSNAFKEWGYSSFEAYARRELRLRADTAAKLTRSYSFLKEHEPKALETRQEKELPPLDVVDLLTRARERAKVSDEDIQSIRQEVFEDGANPTRHAVVKRFREIDPDAFRGKPRAPKEAGGSEDLRKALLLGERFETLVTQHPSLSDNAKQVLSQVVAEVRQAFEATKQAEDEAANTEPVAVSA